MYLQQIQHACMCLCVTGEPSAGHEHSARAGGRRHEETEGETQAEEETETAAGRN